MGILDKFFKTSSPQENQNTNKTGFEQAQSKQDRNRDACPYCGTVFTKPPKRKAKCTKCGNEYYVRTTQTIFNSDLLTEEDALASDFFKELEYLGASTDDYSRTEADLAKRWGTKPKSYDIVWGVSNQLVTKPPKVENDHDPQISLLQQAKDVALAQANYQYRRGKDPYSYLKSVRNCEIQIATNRSFPSAYFEIETQDCCKECRKYQGKKYTAEQIEKESVLPIKECANKNGNYPWCTCWYSPIRYNSKSQSESGNHIQANLDVKVDGTVDCPRCGTNMGQPKTKGLFVKHLFLGCPSCGLTAKAKIVDATPTT